MLDRGDEHREVWRPGSLRSERRRLAGEVADESEETSRRDPAVDLGLQIETVEPLEVGR